MERWRSIPGVPGYEASDLGRIRSVERRVNCGPHPGFRIVPNCVLKPFVVRATGYLQVKVLGRKHSAHRLIASAWCDGYFAGAWVDHRNGDRTDNRPKNLDWVTPSENSRRSYQSGRAPTAKGKFSSDHPTAKSVVSTNILTGEARVWPSAMDAVRAGFDSSCISRCCKGQSAHHKGHRWEYGDRNGVRWTGPGA